MKMLRLEDGLCDSIYVSVREITDRNHYKNTLIFFPDIEGLDITIKARDIRKRDRYRKKYYIVVRRRGWIRTTEKDYLGLLNMFFNNVDIKNVEKVGKAKNKVIKVDNPFYGMEI